MTEPARYTDRREEVVTIKDPWDKGRGISFEQGWGTGGRSELAGLPAGTRLVAEMSGGRVTGFQTFDADARWLYRLSDQDLEAEHRRIMEDMDRRHHEQLDENREDWARREAALPDWIRARLESFHHTGGEKFELDGWGYELIVAELAAMYAEQGKPPFEDTAEINAYAEHEGTSGNQHGVAKLLASVHNQDPDYSLAGTPSALTPLTGDKDYSGAEPS